MFGVPLDPSSDFLIHRLVHSIPTSHIGRICNAFHRTLHQYNSHGRIFGARYLQLPEQGNRYIVVKGVEEMFLTLGLHNLSLHFTLYMKSFVAYSMLQGTLVLLTRKKTSCY